MNSPAFCDWLASAGQHCASAAQLRELRAAWERGECPHCWHRTAMYRCGDAHRRNTKPASLPQRLDAAARSLKEP